VPLLVTAALLGFAFVGVAGILVILGLLLFL
jgi:hypothetical protein